MADHSTRSFRKTLFFTFVILALFGVFAVAVREITKGGDDDEWQLYVSFAAILIGVGGAFGLAALSNTKVNAAANVTSIGGIGLGGMMMAYREISKLQLDWLFVGQSLLLVFGAYCLLFWAAVVVDNRHPTPPAAGTNPPPAAP